ncbi:MAG TPA: UV DNA damage repair endonuclease UvsE [Candidatus Hydrogenedentes bacterium]|jgi:UV DNA damage endonuclease|nr:UV DNA damage repair endonuclease UvsE [Candidatus Hydrogenedentota bacterium]HQN01982.1 UV DNA damage repair endonuclease UvsE [Candidatus Hydrogenedentota bacterium]
MIRFGLCCIFIEEPIKFRTITAKTLSTLPRQQQLERISDICLKNAENLVESLHSVARMGIGAFRILSSFFPRYTHPEAGYVLEDLPDAKSILKILKHVNRLRGGKNIRLSFHPDQFVVLNSPNEEVVRKSIAEIEYHAALATLVGAEVINIHAGGGYGDKAASLKRFERGYALLSAAAQQRLTLENDDVLYTPSDLLPLCRDLRIPLVYDVHHHRCNPDSLSVEEATAKAMETWTLRKQEPYFHVSSPKQGWTGRDPKPHADYINPADIPDFWRDIGPFTLDVEAKHKEKAVVKLMDEWPIR